MRMIHVIIPYLNEDFTNCSGKCIYMEMKPLGPITKSYYRGFNEPIFKGFIGLCAFFVLDEGDIDS